MKKIQKATFRIFLFCMAVTAVLMLILVWTPLGQGPDTDGPPLVMRYAMTFFIIGLASFLVWLTTTILEIKERLTGGR